MSYFPDALVDGQKKRNILSCGGSAMSETRQRTFFLIFSLVVVFRIQKE